MRALFIDLASPSPTLAVVTDGTGVVLRQAENTLREQAFFSTLEELMREARVDFRDFTHVACVTGPGGFTSLRLAISAGNALAYALAVPIAGITLPELERVRGGKPLRSVLPMILSGLSYGKPLLLPVYGREPRITRRNVGR